MIYCLPNFISVGGEKEVAVEQYCTKFEYLSQNRAAFLAYITRITRKHRPGIALETRFFLDVPCQSLWGIRRE